MSSTYESKPVVLMTGCSGLIGTRLIENLRDSYRLVGLDLAPVEVDGAEWIKCDLTDTASVRETLEKVREEYGDAIANLDEIPGEVEK